MLRPHKLQDQKLQIPEIIIHERSKWGFKMDKNLEMNKISDYH